MIGGPPRVLEWDETPDPVLEIRREELRLTTS